MILCFIHEPACLEGIAKTHLRHTINQWDHQKHSTAEKFRAPQDLNVSFVLFVATLSIVLAIVVDGLFCSRNRRARRVGLSIGAQGLP